MLMVMLMVMLMLLSGEASPQRWLHCAAGHFAAALRDHADGDADAGADGDADAVER